MLKWVGLVCLITFGLLLALLSVSACPSDHDLIIVNNHLVKGWEWKLPFVSEKRIPRKLDLNRAVLDQKEWHVEVRILEEEKFVKYVNEQKNPAEEIATKANEIFLESVSLEEDEFEQIYPEWGFSLVFYHSISLYSFHPEN